MSNRWALNMQGERIWKVRLALETPLQRRNRMGRRTNSRLLVQGLGSLRAVYEVAFATTLEKRRAIVARQMARRVIYNKDRTKLVQPSGLVIASR